MNAQDAAPIVARLQEIVIATQSGPVRQAFIRRWPGEARRLTWVRPTQVNAAEVF